MTISHDRIIAILDAAVSAENYLTQDRTELPASIRELFNYGIPALASAAQTATGERVLLEVTHNQVLEAMRADHRTHLAALHAELSLAHEANAAMPGTPGDDTARILGTDEPEPVSELEALRGVIAELIAGRNRAARMVVALADELAHTQINARQNLRVSRYLRRATEPGDPGFAPARHHITFTPADFPGMPDGSCSRWRCSCGKNSTQTLETRTAQRAAQIHLVDNNVHEVDQATHDAVCTARAATYQDNSPYTGLLHCAACSLAYAYASDQTTGGTRGNS